jgi:hypothetical protein
MALGLTALLLILLSLGITGLIAGRPNTAIIGLAGGVVLAPLAVIQWSRLRSNDESSPG